MHYENVGVIWSDDENNFTFHVVILRRATVTRCLVSLYQSESSAKIVTASYKCNREIFTLDLLLDVCFSGSNTVRVTKTRRIIQLVNFQCVHRARRAVGTHTVADSPHQKQFLEKTEGKRGRCESGVYSGHKIRTRRAENEMPESAWSRICEPSCKKSQKSFHSRGPAEQKHLSPTVRSLKYVVRDCAKSADLRNRECTFSLGTQKNRKSKGNARWERHSLQDSNFATFPSEPKDVC